MKILLAVHGFPPELVGGVEWHTRELALGLARQGHSVLVVAGTVKPSTLEGRIEVRREPLAGPRGERVDVARIARHDLYFDHWHKSHHADVAQAFRELLREFRPDVVHVQHWLRLTRDLVAIAGREGIAGVVTLHDAWASCPIAFRVRPDTLQACDALVGPHPCVRCAAQVPPRTPWVPTEAGYMLLAERQRDLAREIDLARALIAPSRAHARALERWLGRSSDSLDFEIIAPCARANAPRSPAQPSVTASPIPRFVLTTWSQIARHKGLDILIAAVVDATARLGGKMDLRCIIHGSVADPVHAAELRARAGNCVEWASPDQDPGTSGEAKLYVSSSRAHESYGVSADEAAQLGFALLLPDAPAFQERWSGIAEFYSSGSATSLSDQLVRFARDPALLQRARQAAAEYAARLPSNEARVQRHLTVYERALASPGAVPPAENWFDARMSTQAALAWDRSLSQRSNEELGL